VLLCWCVGVLVCWCVGVLVCWCVGVLVCWCAGVLVCWCVGGAVLCLGLCSCCPNMCLASLFSVATHCLTAEVSFQPFISCTLTFPAKDPPGTHPTTPSQHLSAPCPSPEVVLLPVPLRTSPVSPAHHSHLSLSSRLLGTGKVSCLELMRRVTEMIIYHKYVFFWLTLDT